MEAAGAGDGGTVADGARGGDGDGWSASAGTSGGGDGGGETGGDGAAARWRKPSGKGMPDSRGRGRRSFDPAAELPFS
jgi:hypothetical protein